MQTQTRYNNRVLLGKGLWSSGASFGPIISPIIKKHNQLRIWVQAYASAGIISLQVGNAAIDTATNYAAGILEGATLTTTSVSVTGIRLGGSTTTGPRYIEVEWSNWSAAQVKRFLIRSNSISVSAATAPTLTNIAGIWVNTTAFPDRIQFTSFNGVTGTTTTNFSGAAEVEWWGWDDE